MISWQTQLKTENICRFVEFYLHATNKINIFRCDFIKEGVEDFRNGRRMTDILVKYVNLLSIPKYSYENDNKENEKTNRRGIELF